MTTADEKSRPRRGPLRRLIRWLAWTVLGALVLLLLGALVLTLWFPAEKVRRLALDELEQRLGVAIDSGPLEVDLLRGLVLHQPRLRPRPGGRSPLRLERLVFEYSPVQLLRRRLVVESLLLEAPRVELIEGAQGIGLLQLLGAGRWKEVEPEPVEPQPTGEGGFVLELQSVRVSDGRLLLGFGQIVGRLAGIEVGARLRLEQGRLGAQVQAGWPLPQERNLFLGRDGDILQASCGGRVEGRLQRRGWSLTADLELNRLSMLGRQLPGGWRLRLQAAGPWPPAAAGLRLERLELLRDGQPLLAAAGSSEGDGRWLVQAQGRLPAPLLASLLGRPGIAGRLRLEALELAGQLGGPEVAVSARLRLDELASEIPGLGLSGGWAKAEVDGVLAAGGATLTDMRLNFEAEQLRLAELRWRRPRLRVGGGARLNWASAARPLELRVPRLEARLAGTALTVARSGGRAANLEVRLRAQQVAWDGRQTPQLAAAELQVTAGSTGVGPLAARSLWLRAGLEPRRDGLSWQWPQALRLGAKIRLRKLRAGPLLAERLVLAARSRLAPGRLEVTNLQAELSEPSLRQWPGWRLPRHLRLAARGSLPGRRLRLDECRLSLEDWGTLGVQGQGDLEGGSFRLGWQAQTLLEPAAALVAPLLPATAMAVTGRLRARGELAGTWPDLARGGLDAAGTARLEIAEGSLRVGALRLQGVGAEFDLQLQGSGSGVVRTRGRVGIGDLQLPALAARDLRLDFTALRQTAELGLDWKLAAGQVDLPWLFATELRGARLAGAARLLGGKQGRLRRLQIELPSHGLQADGQGQVMLDGDAPGGPRPRFAGSLTVGFSSPVPVEWVGGLAMRGAAGADLEVVGDGAGHLQCEGRLSFAGLELSMPGLQAAGLRGRMQVQQQLAWSGQGLQLVGSPQQRWQRPGGTRSAYDQALGPLRQGGKMVQADRLRLGRLRLEHPRAEVELHQGRLRLGNLQVGLLGGDVSADLAMLLAPPQAQALGLWLEASELDLARVAQVEGGDARVGGNMRLEARARPAALDAEIHLTRIGNAALRSLLKAIDPGGDSSLAGLRNFLDRYRVVPRSASLLLRRGLLDLELAFDLGIAARTAARMIRGFEGQTFRLRSLPVGSWLRSVLARLR